VRYSGRPSDIFAGICCCSSDLSASVVICALFAQAILVLLFCGKVPLMWLTANHLNGKTGNLVVWMTVMILQPVGIFLYYHDYYILNA